MSERVRLGRGPTLVLLAVLIVGLALAVADPFTVVSYLAYVTVGGMVVIRRPRTSIGWLLIAIAFGFIGTSARPDFDIAALKAGTAGIRDTLIAWLAGWSGSADYLLFFALIVVFPSGRLPDRPWRVPTQVALACGAALAVLTASAPTISFNPGGSLDSIEIPNRLAVLPGLPFWSALESLVPSPDFFILPFIVLLLVGATSILVRYRRSSGILRLQLRWLVAAVTFMVAAVLFGLTSLLVFPDTLGTVAWWPAVVAYPTIPIAIGVAVLRYRLFEIDRIISRTIAYAGVTGVMAATFAGSILAFQALLSPFTQKQTIAVAASTLAVYAISQPALRRIRRAVDRRFDRARYDAERTAASFSGRLRDEVDLATITSDLTATTSGALAPTSFGIWLHQPGSAE